jgi:hypothetical protein
LITCTGVENFIRERALNEALFHIIDGKNFKES